jgi:hypothetical protein
MQHSVEHLPHGEQNLSSESIWMGGRPADEHPGVQDGLCGIEREERESALSAHRGARGPIGMKMV